jgi:hypothetical protein
MGTKQSEQIKHGLAIAAIVGVFALTLVLSGCGREVDNEGRGDNRVRKCVTERLDIGTIIQCEGENEVFVPREGLDVLGTPLPGPKGDAGQDGQDGKDGSNGESIVGSQGLPGDKGDKGDTGAVGEKGETGDTGASGEKGDKGDKGDPASATILVDGEALRTYDPSTFTDLVHEIPEHSLAVVPAEFTTVEGATGTGWLSVTYAGVKFCYQGDGVNNDAMGTKFRLKRIRDGGNCDANGGFVTVASVPMAIPSEHSAQLYTVSVHGGGISTTLRLANPRTKVRVRLVIYKLN